MCKSGVLGLSSTDRFRVRLMSLELGAYLWGVPWASSWEEVALCLSNSLKQELVNCGLKTKFKCPPYLQIKFSRNTNTPTWLGIFYGCIWGTTVKWNSCYTYPPMWPIKADILMTWPFTEKVCWTHTEGFLSSGLLRFTSGSGSTAITYATKLYLKCEAHFTQENFKIVSHASLMRKCRERENLRLLKFPRGFYK